MEQEKDYNPISGYLMLIVLAGRIDIWNLFLTYDAQSGVYRLTGTFYHIDGHWICNRLSELFQCSYLIWEI